MRCLETALVYCFNLDKSLPISERRAISRQMLHACVDVGIEPRDVHQTMKLFNGLDQWNHRGVAGIFQINEIRALDGTALPILDSTKSFWNHLRAEGDATGHFDDAIVIVTVTHNSRRLATTLVGIEPETLQAARKSQTFPRNVQYVNQIGVQLFFDASGYPRKRVTDRVGDCIKHVSMPLNLPFLLILNIQQFSHLNEHIRYDEENELDLHTPMRESDKRFIINAYRGVQTVVWSSAQSFTLKVLREPVYEGLRDSLGICIDGSDKCL